MTRPPHARSAVLQVAEKIVMRHGAANLTYDELVRESGITRGGITYHFPTKESLLKALIDNDLGQWRDCVARKRPLYQGANAELLAHLDSLTEPDPNSSQLSAGLLGAAMSSKELLEPWREEYETRYGQVCGKSADPGLARVLMLAAEGLFWQETLGLSPLSAAEREQIVARLLEMGRAAPGAAAKPAKATVLKATAVKSGTTREKRP